MPRATRLHISPRQATYTRPAILLAERLGSPLNVAATVNLDRISKTTTDNFGGRFAKLRAIYQRWARSTTAGHAAFTPAFLWVVENEDHMHVHWMLHVPPARLTEFQRLLPAWINRSLGSYTDPHTVDARPIKNVLGWRLYSLKGIDPRFAQLYRVRSIPQGAVTGKRLGFSQNIGPAQCRKRGTKIRWQRPRP